MNPYDINIDDTIFTVDKIDNKNQLCMGTVMNTCHHAAHSAYVEWTNPKRDGSWKRMNTLQKSAVAAIASRFDLSPTELEQITGDAKSRGLLEE